MKYEMCRRLLLSLADRGRREGLQQQLVTRFPPAYGRQLDAILSQRGDFDTLDGRTWIHGPRVKKGTPALWPVLALRVSGEMDQRQITSRVALFFESEGIESEGMQAVAWRFEPPGEGEGAHGYHHAQPISHWRKNDPSLSLPVSLPVNTSQPAFPLYADDQLGLVFAIVLAVYGMTFLHELLLDNSIRPAFQGIRNQLPLFYVSGMSNNATTE